MYAHPVSYQYQSEAVRAEAIRRVRRRYRPVGSRRGIGGRMRNPIFTWSPHPRLRIWNLGLATSDE